MPREAPAFRAIVVQPVHRAPLDNGEPLDPMVLQEKLVNRVQPDQLDRQGNPDLQEFPVS